MIGHELVPPLDLRRNAIANRQLVFAIHVLARHPLNDAICARHYSLILLWHKLLIVSSRVQLNFDARLMNSHNFGREKIEVLIRSILVDAQEIGALHHHRMLRLVMVHIVIVFSNGTGESG